MRLLVTGAFGNIGKAVIGEACSRGHELVVFEVDNKKTRKAARQYKDRIAGVVFGDIRDFGSVKAAVAQSDAVIHLAAIIPPLSKKNRDLTMAVNYGGTENLLKAIQTANPGMPLVFTSSASVMGPTQHQNRLVNRNDPLVVTGNYEESKIKCEELLKRSADNYLVFRLAGVLPTFSPWSFRDVFPLLEEIFDMHPDMRLEMITAQDVATALVTGAEKLKTKATPKNQAYILGGGEKNGWQLHGKQFLSSFFGAFSLPLPDTKYFTPNINTYHLDWYDTKKAQQEFNFQNHTLTQYLQQLQKSARPFKLPITLLRRFILKKLTQMSPYHPQNG
ncbi:MAG: NAD(P)-dependent oxidoreductase [Candidatus Bathyarchaeota archaeon]|nr:NAD(P)-dependent oxidoreductase [Candidatus Bathyarchaeota archaeon]